MSEPKRYAIVADFQPPWAKMHEFPSAGEWVRYDDYARLNAEVEKSKQLNTELIVLCNRQANDIQRLTKAGDAMEKDLLGYIPDTIDGYYRPANSVFEWRASKELEY